MACSNFVLFRSMAMFAIVFVFPVSVNAVGGTFDPEKDNLKEAAQLWCVDASSAQATYGHISMWNTTGITDMSQVFYTDSDTTQSGGGCSKFNDDISGWDTSSAKDMYGMFWGASVFNRKLCGDAWVHSQAKKTIMFAGTSGSISLTACAMASVVTVYAQTISRRR